MTACMYLWECLSCLFLRWYVIIRWEPVSTFFEGTVLFSFIEMIILHYIQTRDHCRGLKVWNEPICFCFRSAFSDWKKKYFLDIQRFNQLEVLKTTFSQIVTIPFERWQVPSTVAKRRDA